MGRSGPEVRDIYYRRAKEEGWRARSAFKLLQIDEEVNLFENVERCIDLCAAPGSWSQVVSKRVWASSNKKDRVKIVSVDIQDMAPIDGVVQIKGDITKESTVEEIVKSLGGEQVQLILCDGASDVTGLHDMDEYIQSGLLLSALNVAMRLLEPGGTFLAKFFKGRHAFLTHAQFRVFFSSVQFIKPTSSRSHSMESFIVCERFKLPIGYALKSQALLEEPGEKRTLGGDGLALFVQSGDLSGFDEILGLESNDS
ncbi:putative tRNA (cytidine(32)/guanosine(34)-2'-O)-methyltransferase [Schistocerca gregaria]|uniref:putative tRNA (cytidine(32)/guanosine(34)-2'-O)-methyltransferase n=1 Tax=Schistocerca gregaria TaxID=7010 RepID=UPI00211F1CDC|nr:putative tRNA (cytidine(32)/guanosine(34)-2'-O)-methyltransferase [Schistocerca gregaria]